MNASTWTAAAFTIAIAAAPTVVAAQTPILEFGFNEGSGTKAVNSGSLGSGSDGTISGPQFSSNSASAGGFSLWFDATSDFVEVPDTFDYGSNVTVEAWIKPDNLIGQQAIYDDYGNPGVFMALFDKKLEWGVSTTQNPGQGVAIFKGDLCNGLWQHIAGTYDGSILRAYINGVEVGTVAATGGILDNSANPTHIGADSAQPQFLGYDGRMDDLRVYLSVLDPDQLGDGAPMFICGEVTGDCLVGTNDALAALQMAVQLRATNGAADLDYSLVVTAGDALGILRVAVGNDDQTNICNGLQLGTPSSDPSTAEDRL